MEPNIIKEICSGANIIARPIFEKAKKLDTHNPEIGKKFMEYIYEHKECLCELNWYVRNNIREYIVESYAQTDDTIEKEKIRSLYKAIYEKNIEDDYAKYDDSETYQGLEPD